jgi:hypothetical protein
MRKIEKEAEKVAQRFPVNIRLGVTVALLEFARTYKKKCADVVKESSWNALAQRLEKLDEYEDGNNEIGPKR